MDISFYVGVAAVVGVVWVGLYKTPIKNMEEEGKDYVAPPVMRSKFPYRDSSTLDPLNSRGVINNVVGFQESGLNGMPKSTSIGRGGTLYVSRTTPDKLFKKLM